MAPGPTTSVYATACMQLLRFGAPLAVMTFSYLNIYRITRRLKRQVSPLASQKRERERPEIGGHLSSTGLTEDTDLSESLQLSSTANPAVCENDHGDPRSTSTKPYDSTCSKEKSTDGKNKTEPLASTDVVEKEHIKIDLVIPGFSEKNGCCDLPRNKNAYEDVTAKSFFTRSDETQHRESSPAIRPTEAKLDLPCSDEARMWQSTRTVKRNREITSGAITTTLTRNTSTDETNPSQNNIAQCMDVNTLCTLVYSGNDATSANGMNTTSPRQTPYDMVTTLRHCTPEPRLPQLIDAISLEDIVTRVQRHRTVIVKGVVLLEGMFLACWAPYIGLTLIMTFDDDISPTLAECLYILAIANSLMNVFLYTMSKSSFRRVFTAFLMKVVRKCRNTRENAGRQERRGDVMTISMVVQ